MNASNQGVIELSYPRIKKLGKTEDNKTEMRRHLSKDLKHFFLYFILIVSLASCVYDLTKWGPKGLLGS